MPELPTYNYYINWDKKEIIYYEGIDYKPNNIPDGFVFLGSSDFPNKEIITATMIGKQGQPVVGYKMEELK